MSSVISDHVFLLLADVVMMVVISAITLLMILSVRCFGRLLIDLAIMLLTILLFCDFCLSVTGDLVVLLAVVL